MNIQIPNSLSAINKKTTVHHYTDMMAHEEKGPHIITRAEGVRLFDDEGRGFIDGMAGLWCSALGHSEDRLKKAAMKQFDALTYTHIFAHRSHQPAIDQRPSTPQSRSFGTTTTRWAAKRRRRSLAATVRITVSRRRQAV